MGIPPSREITVQMRISDAKFIGESADQFRVKTSPTLLLDPVRGQNDKGNITVEYVGSSSYETKGTLRITASGGKEQDIRVIANPGRQQTDYVVLDASLDKIELRSPRNSSFAPDWKLTYAMGTEEIGLPRWTSGMSVLSVGFKNDMSVGVVLPMNMTTGDIPSPLGYDTRLLASPMGYNVTFDFTFGFPFSLGGSLTVTNKFDGQDPYHNLQLVQTSETDITKPNYYNDFFNISTIAQLYYPIMFKDRESNPNVTFRLDLGGTFMQIQRNHVVLPGESTKEGKSFAGSDVGKMVNLMKLKDVADVYARLSFINLSARNNYGIGLGYVSGRMMADAWLELTSWLRVEAKYSFLLRDREIWENETSYFLVTPRFRLGFPSIFN
jgi:hypothetical protein